MINPEQNWATKNGIKMPLFSIKFFCQATFLINISNRKYILMLDWVIFFCVWSDSLNLDHESMLLAKWHYSHFARVEFIGRPYDSSGCSERRREPMSKYSCNPSEHNSLEWSLSYFSCGRFLLYIRVYLYICYKYSLFMFFAFCVYI